MVEAVQVFVTGQTGGLVRQGRNCCLDRRMGGTWGTRCRGG